MVFQMVRSATTLVYIYRCWEWEGLTLYFAQTLMTPRGWTHWLIHWGWGLYFGLERKLQQILMFPSGWTTFPVSLFSTTISCRRFYFIHCNISTSTRWTDTRLCPDRQMMGLTDFSHILKMKGGIDIDMRGTVKTLVLLSTILDCETSL